jgi:sugar O-acyltransferase (sialic acid O-acetyltransferase NeuD family)
MTELYAVYGASGCGRSLMPVAREHLCRLGIKAEICFIDDSLIQPTRLNGHLALSYETFKTKNADHKYVLIAIANSQVREILANKLEQDGIDHWSIQANNTVIMDEAIIGRGAALSPFVTIASNTKIGQYFHANLYSYVEHDCVIGDYVTFAPGVKCNGNIHIEDHAYIGTGAVIKQGTPDRPLVIGKGAIVGMGAVVTKSVPAGVTVVGNPARILEKK